MQPQEMPTDRQIEVLLYVADYWRRHHYSPSLKEIQRHLEVRSLNAVADRVKALLRKGLLTRQRLVARSLVVTALGRRWIAR